MGLIFHKTHPGSIPDFNTTEKNLMWLAGFRTKYIGRYLTHAVATCKKVKLIVKVWFSLLINQTFNAFK